MFLLLLVALASAQIDPQDQTVELKECRNVEVREVLTRLFKLVGVAFSMDESIKGRISVRLPPMRFDTALALVLKSCDLSYRTGCDSTCKSGVYQIIRRESPIGLDGYWTDREAMPSYEPDDFLDGPAPRIEALKTPASELFLKVLGERRETSLGNNRIMRLGGWYVIGFNLDAPVIIDNPARTRRDLLTQITRVAHASLSKGANGVWVVVGPPAKPTSDPGGSGIPAAAGAKLQR